MDQKDRNAAASSAVMAVAYIVFLVAMWATLNRRLSQSSTSVVLLVPEPTGEQPTADEPRPAAED